MSFLLNSTATTGNRKKCSGVTSYKRPGPPTPSKNGSRLSIGTIHNNTTMELPREVLKETAMGTNQDFAPNTTKVTPARFSFLSSRFSLGGIGSGIRDEVCSCSNFLHCYYVVDIFQCGQGRIYLCNCCVP